MHKSKDIKPSKGSRKRKQLVKPNPHPEETDNQLTAGSSSKQDNKPGEEMVKPPKQSKIEKSPKKSTKETVKDSFEAETSDDSDFPSNKKPQNLNKPVTGGDSNKKEESDMPKSPNVNIPQEMQKEDTKPREPQSAGTHEESNPDDPGTESQVKSETEDKKHESQISNVPEESNIDNSTTDKQSETENAQSEPQSSSVSGELKPDDSSVASEEKDLKKMESSGKSGTLSDTDASSTITSSSKGRDFTDTGSDKESSNSDGSKGISSSSDSKESDSSSVPSYPASEVSGPPSVASVVSSINPLEIDFGLVADQENTSESQGEGKLSPQSVIRAAAELMSRKFKEFSSSSSDDKNEEV